MKLAQVADTHSSGRLSAHRSEFPGAAGAGLQTLFCSYFSCPRGAGSWRICSPTKGIEQPVESVKLATFRATELVVASMVYACIDLCAFSCSVWSFEPTPRLRRNGRALCNFPATRFSDTTKL